MKRLFGEISDQPIFEVTIRSKAGAEAKILNWGAVVRDFVVPTRSGPQSVVLGLDRLEDYVNHSPHLGALAGRFANRIRDGRFSIDDQTYQLEQNFLGKHSLHGGQSGFGCRSWQLAHYDATSVTLLLFSSDGDGGFPGNLTVTCRYSLIEPATLRTDLTATTDAPTVINLALHSYYNLDGSDSILDHELLIAADFITKLDDELIPTGEICPVSGSPFDFNSFRPIRYHRPNDVTFHYDQNFIVRGRAGALRHAASVRSVKNGLTMDVFSTEPCIQFYDAMKLMLPVAGHGGRALQANSGFCLEPQNVPNSPNIAHFPDPVLRPGHVYSQVTDYRFY